MRKLIRWLSLVLLLAASSVWGQQYISDNDGRNWNQWSYDLKSGVVMGMMTAEHAYINLIQAAGKYGNGDVAANFVGLAEGLVAGGGWSVRMIREALDTYYQSPINQTVVIWKAYFLSRGISIWTGEK